MFRVFDIPEGLADAAEAMGTKPKFWLRHPELRMCLFKEARPGTGEDWSEKIACELAAALSLPHAHYELARCGEKRGTLSQNLLSSQEALVHGNEVLFAVEPEYPDVSGSSRNFYRVTQHTLDLVFRAIKDLGVPRNWAAPPGIADAVDVFVGYLVFDAWIGNTDRHHQNWALVWHQELEVETDPAVPLTLAPTFDHASSLGRELTDQERSERLHTRDAGRSVSRYVDRASSALYNASDDSRPLMTLDVAMKAAQVRPNAARIWLARLAGVSQDDVQAVLSEIPESVASSTAKEFAATMLELNKKRLLAGGSR